MMRDMELEMPSWQAFLDGVTPMMRAEMEEAMTDPVSFYTPQRRLIAANHAYYDTFPTHKPGIYMLDWSFTDEGKDILVNWDNQVDQGVAWHRGLMGRYGHTEWAREAHERLWQFEDFRRKWEAAEVSYARPVASEAIIKTPHGKCVLLMENWQLQYGMPIQRSRAKLKPVD